ncbi:unnamed protein product [Closterium sp. NIES-53]
MLPLATARTSPLNSSTPIATTAAATTPTAATTSTTTPTATTTAATEAPTPATTPTTTSATSTASTASTTTTPVATSTTLASLALAAAALPTRSRSSPDVFSTKDVNSSSRSVGGGKGGGGTPIKEGCARSATSNTYSDYASLSCMEVLFEQVDSEVCGVKCPKKNGPGAGPAQKPSVTASGVSLSFTLDSGASQCFFCDHTTVTPLSALVPVALADPTSGPAVARSSTTLPCPAVPSSFLTGLYIPSFSRNLVAVSGQVAVSGPVAASCSCRSLAHPTVLWHHCLGHPSLLRLRSMASHILVSCLPRVFPSLPPSLAPPCTPCVAGCLRATPHSSSLRPATAPFQTLHVWGPAPTLGPERERYFLVVVDDYSRYTTVFPLAKKSEVTSTLIRWFLATEGTHGSRVHCLHSDRGGEFCSGVLAGFCSEQGIRQSWTLVESPQHNGVPERRIGLVMDIARTSMIHACAPHFLWPYALRYAAHQLNLQPRVSWPEVSPTSLWTGSPGVGSAFHVWSCLALVRDTSAD